MRFRSLHLRAYGGFTDRLLEFGRSPGQVDIVLGANEAGKSTALRAIEGFCYGIEEKTGDNHVHPYDRLRIGAEIEMGNGTCFTVFRKKGRKNTVRGADDAILPDEILDDALCGIGPAGFRALFCLDFERIARGSDSLLEEGGEVGKLLFEARSDLSLRPVLKALKDRSEELFKGSSRSNAVIDSALRKHDDLRKSARKSDIPQYKDRERNLQSLEQRATGLRIELADYRKAHNRLSRFQSAIEQISLRTSLLKEIDELGPVVELDSDFSEQRSTAQTKLSTANERVRSGVAEVQRIKQEIDHAEIDDAVLTWQEEIVELYEQIGKISQMAKDLPLEEGKAKSKAEEAAEALSKFWPRGVEAPAFTAVSDREHKRVRKVDREGTQLRTGLENIQNEIEDTKKQIRGLERDLANLPEPTAPESLRPLISAAKGLGDIDNQIVRCRTDLDEAMAEAQVVRIRLQLPVAALEDLVRLPAPLATTIRVHEENLRTLRDRLRVQKDNIEAAHQRIKVADRERRALVLAGSVPTEADLVFARNTRDDTWRLVVTRFIEGGEVAPEALAEPAYGLQARFEETLEAADQTADRLRREAKRAARLGEIDAEAESAAAAEAAARTAWFDSEHELDEATLAWKEAWLGVDTTIRSPGEMLEWRDAFGVFCNLETKARINRTKLDEMSELRALARSDLISVLGAQVGGDTLAPVLITSERLLDESDARREARAAKTALLVNDRNRLVDAEELRGKLLEDQQTWMDDWAAAIAPLNVPEVSDAVEVDGALEALNKAASLSAEVAIAQKRAIGMRRDINDFERRVACIHEGIGTGNLLSHAMAIRAFSQRLETARLVLNRVSALQSDLVRIEREISFADIDIREASIDLSGLCTLAGCERIEDLIEAERRYSKWKNLRDRLEVVESGILAFSAGLSLDEFCAEVSMTDADTLAGQLWDAEETQIRLEAQLTGIDQEIGQTRQSLLEAESTGTLLAARSDAEAELAKACSSVRPYLIYKLAETLVAAQLEEFRRANQGPILARASQVFCELTHGSFTDLISDLDEKDNPVLVAIRSTGERVGVEGLSSATRVGLYLALRIACLHHHADARECVPFFADDILLDFDDDRARCAFSVLGELAQRTQVILFTHHAHLTAIAADVLGEAASIVHLVR
jgi:uncharacterized protein YhaN